MNGSYVFQRLFEIRDQIVGILYSNSDPQDIFRDRIFRTFHSRPMLNQAFDAAGRRRRDEQLHRFCHSNHRFGVTLYENRKHPAKSSAHLTRRNGMAAVESTANRAQAA